MSRTLWLLRLHRYLEEPMKLRCVDNAHLERGTLILGGTYEVDPRLNIETNFLGAPTYYLINGRRYGSWRFEVVREDRAKHPADGLGEVFTMDEFNQSIRQ